MQYDLIEHEANYSLATFPEPRPFQDTAHEKLRQGAREGNRCQMIMSPTGSGKTYLGMRIIHEALKRGKRAIFVCDRTTLINQTSEVADSYGLGAHSVIQAGHWRYDLRQPFQIASIQTLARRAWPEADVIVIDECFPAGTLVETPNGKIKIEDIKSNDLVYSACGVSRVKSVFSKQTKNICKVKLNDGTEFECTEDHPIFTGMGWKSAISMEKGERLFRVQDVLDLWGNDQAVHDCQGGALGESGNGIIVLEAPMLRSILRKEIQEPDAQQGSKRKNVYDVEKNKSRSKDTLRQWNRNDEASSTGFVETWPGVGAGIRGEDEAEARKRLPISLQDRCSESRIDDSNRSRREQSLRDIEERSGREEGRTSAILRVESIEIEKQESDRTVYNLRVSGHPSYFANGVLVHNCHSMYSAWTSYIEDCSANVIGLSATPFSKGLGRLFTNLINAATMHDLTQSGVLVPMRVFSCTKIDMRGAETSGGEWKDSAAAERGMDIIGDVVSEWKKYGENRKTIVFGATINHCVEMCRQFNESGIMAATFTSDTTDAERKVLLDEYKKPDGLLKILISVEALAKGFDVKDVGCVCDCRPLRKSLSTAIQMWGRGLRSSPDTGKVDCILLDFSGNIIRFADDFSDIYYNGLDQLDAGEKLDKTIRRDDDEDKEPSKCSACGFSPCGKRCISCGHEKQPKNLIEHLPGEMTEVMIGKSKLADDRKHLYEQICTYTRSHGNPETAKQRAWYLFQELTGGIKPANQWKFDDQPNTPITRATLNHITRQRIAFAKRKVA